MLLLMLMVMMKMEMLIMMAILFTPIEGNNNKEIIVVKVFIIKISLFFSFSMVEFDWPLGVHHLYHNNISNIIYVCRSLNRSVCLSVSVRSRPCVCVSVCLRVCIGL